MADFAPRFDDKDRTFAQLQERLRQEQRSKRQTLPEEFRFRRAETLSPEEHDRLREIMGMPRDSRFAVQSAQAKWQSDTKAVAARAADITAAAARLTEALQYDRTTKESGHG